MWKNRKLRLNLSKVTQLVKCWGRIWTQKQLTPSLHPFYPATLPHCCQNTVVQVVIRGLKDIQEKESEYLGWKTEKQPHQKTHRERTEMFQSMSLLKIHFWCRNTYWQNSLSLSHPLILVAASIVFLGTINCLCTRKSHSTPIYHHQYQNSNQVAEPKGCLV